MPWLPDKCNVHEVVQLSGQVDRSSKADQRGTARQGIT